LFKAFDSMAQALQQRFMPTRPAAQETPGPRPPAIKPIGPAPASAPAAGGDTQKLSR
jgi:hypothetical protein